MAKRSPKRVVSILSFAAILANAPHIVCQHVDESVTPVAPQEQVYTPHMVFDIASIRESRDGNYSFIDNTPKSSYYHAERVSVWALLLRAYGLDLPGLVKNIPNWAMTTRFDVTAKSDASTDDALAKLSNDDFRAEKRHMLQVLLADRFKLKAHTETGIATNYELLPNARNSKLMLPVHVNIASVVGTCNIHASSKGRDIDSKGCPFPILLNTLKQELGADVIDKTALSGAYTYHLMWSTPTAKLQENEERYPYLVDALKEQLGLELKQGKGPVTYLVIDHVERPTAN